LGIKKNNERTLVAGIGSALTDLLIHEEDAFLEKCGAVKGGMVYTEPEHLGKMLTLTANPPSVVPGGSACNTIIGVGKLGGPARFVGKCGKGEIGQLYEQDLRRNGVEPLLFTSATPSGRVLSVITPDAQRSMMTYLGASAETRPEEITPGCFADSAIVHVEGYLLFNRELIQAALESARQAGALISIDLASFTVVEQAKDFLDDLVREYVDILIANEDEAAAFTGFTRPDDAIKALSEKSPVSVLKVGPEGSYVSEGKEIIKIAAKIGEPIVDTTGAGDLWASGFLYGLAHDFSLEKAAMLGSLCGYEVCKTDGARIPEEKWEGIRRYFL
jgi:sugar/nucleoside kinase (ribokinase family)